MTVTLPQAKRQRALLKTFGFNALITFVFVVVFLSVDWSCVLWSLDGQLGQLCNYAYVVVNIAPICHVFVYVWRHDEVRRGMATLCRICNRG